MLNNDSTVPPLLPSQTAWNCNWKTLWWCHMAVTHLVYVSSLSLFFSPQPATIKTGQLGSKLHVVIKWPVKYIYLNFKLSWKLGKEFLNVQLISIKHTSTVLKTVAWSLREYYISVWGPLLTDFEQGSDMIRFPPWSNYTWGSSDGTSEKGETGSEVTWETTVII